MLSQAEERDCAVAANDGNGNKGVQMRYGLIFSLFYLTD